MKHSCLNLLCNRVVSSERVAVVLACVLCELWEIRTTAVVKFVFIYGDGAFVLPFPVNNHELRGGKA